MRDALQRRLEELRQEYESGRQKGQELQRQQAMLQETMLRISGAIQVLEEELERDGVVDSTPRVVISMPLEAPRTQRT